MTRRLSAFTARSCIFLFLTFVCSGAFSQDHQAYMIPPKVYVGDRANLIVPLKGSGGGDVELPRSGFPVSADIDFHRITVEHRPGSSRLVIEFSAYTPGFLEIPPFEIAGEVFKGLRVDILSILGNDITDTILSGPSSPLAIPGTGVLIYGTLSAVILSIILTLWVFFRGRVLLKDRLNIWRRKRLIATMKRIEKNLRKAVEKNADLREILTGLSAEFRSFLSFLTGENCRSMTEREIGLLMSHTVPQSEPHTENCGTGDGAFLEGFFSRCDGFRFRGGTINGGETTALLDDLRSYLQALGERERKPKRHEGEAA